MNAQNQTNRRDFLRSSLIGGAAALAARWHVTSACARVIAPQAAQMTGHVALTAGEDRADLAFKGLMTFQKCIAKAIGKKQVVIKPNNVAIDNQLSASHAQNLEGILEFLKTIGKTNIVIAESAANGPTLEGFANYGYDRLASKYGAKLVDLDQAGFEIVQCFDETDVQPHACRMSKVLLDPNRFIISAAKMKTHDRVVTTLSLKNIVVGAPIKDAGFRWDSKSKPGARNDKPLTHGNGFRGINYNLYALAGRLHPHLSVIDGFEGMEGEGPVGGTPVAHKVCVVSQDWLAADRVAVELMGIDFRKVGYLNYCGRAGLGESDLARIEVIGPMLSDHIKTYKLAANIDEQLVWREKLKKV
jgi:uncharacterized protein (DUF362 family)